MNEKPNKKQFESLYEKQPPQAVWERIEDQIEEKGSRGGMSWRTLLSAAAVLLIGLSLWFGNRTGETVVAEAPPINEPLPVSVVEEPVATVENQDLRQETSHNPAEDELEQEALTPVKLVAASNPGTDKVDPVSLDKLPLAATKQLPVRQTEVVVQVQLDRSKQTRTSLVKLPRAEMEIKIDSKAQGQLVQLQSEKQPYTLAVSENKKPALRFRGLTTTESALYIVKDEIDHIAGDVVMAGKRKLKDFNIQL